MQESTGNKQQETPKVISFIVTEKTQHGETSEVEVFGDQITIDSGRILRIYEDGQNVAAWAPGIWLSVRPEEYQEAEFDEPDPRKWDSLGISMKAGGFNSDPFNFFSAGYADETAVNGGEGDE